MAVEAVDSEHESITLLWLMILDVRLINKSNYQIKFKKACLQTVLEWDKCPSLLICFANHRYYGLFSAQSMVDIIVYY